MQMKIRIQEKIRKNTILQYPFPHPSSFSFPNKKKKNRKERRNLPQSSIQSNTQSLLNTITPVIIHTRVRNEIVTRSVQIAWLKSSAQLFDDLKEISRATRRRRRLSRLSQLYSSLHKFLSLLTPVIAFAQPAAGRSNPKPSAGFVINLL